jgi:hypothetical protein
MNTAERFGPSLHRLGINFYSAGLTLDDGMAVLPWQSR